MHIQILLCNQWRLSYVHLFPNVWKDHCQPSVFSVHLSLFSFCIGSGRASCGLIHSLVGLRDRQAGLGHPQGLHRQEMKHGTGMYCNEWHPAGDGPRGATSAAPAAMCCQCPPGPAGWIPARSGLEAANPCPEHQDPRGRFHDAHVVGPPGPAQQETSSARMSAVVRGCRTVIRAPLKA